MINYIKDMIHYFCVLLLNEYSAVQKAYAKLQLKYCIFNKMIRRGHFVDSVLGYKIRALNHVDLRRLYREIFIEGHYFFETDFKKPFIIDCGANMGLATIYFKWLYPCAEILAFEPDNMVCEILKTNVDSNQLRDVTIINKACFGIEGNVQLFYDAQNRDYVTMSLKEQRFTKNKCAKSAEAVLLSGYVNKKVDFLKMDIEGVEDVVLEDLYSRDKLKLVREMIIEYHHHIDPECDNLSKMLSILEASNFGYQINTFSTKTSEKKSFQDMIIRAYQK